MKKKSRIKVRRGWKIKPLTKVKESAKLYRRQRAKKEIRKELSDLR